MKRIATQDNSIQKRILINIPFVLLVMLMVCFFGGGLLFLMYSIIFAVAFKSAMITLLIAAAGLIAIACGLGLIFAYQKYFEFYNKRMGWQIPTEIEQKQQSNVAKSSFRTYITVPNCALVILAIGSLFAIISAFEGALDRENWVLATKDYKESNGFYEDIQYQPIEYSIKNEPNQDINTIDCDLINKQLVVKYSDDLTDTIKIDNYIQFKNQLAISRDSNGVIDIHENEIKTNDTALEKLLFFVFKDYKAEKQIVITIPSSYKDSISIIGADYITAK